MKYFVSENQIQESLAHSWSMEEEEVRKVTDMDQEKKISGSEIEEEETEGTTISTPNSISSQEVDKNQLPWSCQEEEEYEDMGEDSTDTEQGRVSELHLDPHLSSVHHWNVEDGPISFQMDTVEEHDDAYHNWYEDSHEIEFPQYSLSHRPLSPSSTFPPPNTTDYPIPPPPHAFQTSPTTPQILRRRPISPPNIPPGYSDDEADHPAVTKSRNRLHRFPKCLFSFLFLWTLTLVAFYHYHHKLRNIEKQQQRPPIHLIPPLQKEKEKLLQKASFLANHATPVQEEEYTVRITANSHLSPSHRPDLIVTLVGKLLECQRVKQIQIDWKSGEGERQPPPKTLERDGNVVIVEEGSEFPPILSKAVLLLGDDVLFDCDNLDRGFSLWSHNPERFVGFFAFHHTPTLSPSKPGQSYSLISDRAAFLHKAYLLNHQPSSFMCSHMLLSLRITSITQKPPLMVYGQPKELRSSDVAKKLREYEDTMRQEEMERCLKGLMKEMELEDLPVEEFTYFGGME